MRITYLLGVALLLVVAATSLVVSGTGCRDCGDVPTSEGVTILGGGYYDCNGTLCPAYSGNCTYIRCCGPSGMYCYMRCVSHYCAEWTWLCLFPPCCTKWVTDVFYNCFPPGGIPAMTQAMPHYPI